MKKIKILKAATYYVSDKKRQALGEGAEVEMPEDRARRLVEMGYAECAGACEAKPSKKAIKEVAENKALEPELEDKGIFSKKKKSKKKGSDE